MTTVNQGRNEIRFNNSGGKCLLENWVEERAVDHIDPIAQINDDMTSSAQIFKDGHRGLLTTNFDDPASNRTEVRDNYKVPKGSGVRTEGIKGELIMQSLMEKHSRDVMNEYNAPPPPIELISTTQRDFNKLDFVPKKPVTTAHHDYASDQAVTFWSEHRDKIHAHSQVKTRDTVFRKNSSFSKPIEEYWNQPMPYELEVVPKM